MNPRIEFSLLKKFLNLYQESVLDNRNRKHSISLENSLRSSNEKRSLSVSVKSHVLNVKRGSIGESSKPISPRHPLNPS